MTISVGDKLPGATLLQMGANGPEAVQMADRLAGRKVVIFGLPGAFTGTCTMSHVPSFMRTRDQFAAKGVDEVICVSVNDPFVMKAWSDSTGAAKAGVVMLGDAESAFTTAIGMNYSRPNDGFTNRSRRYALYAVDGVVQVLHTGDTPGTCDRSGGEALLDAI
jgi:glutaredoxin/glutathione-dependent peroxiredoxin